jgi:hypothetical protein
LWGCTALAAEVLHFVLFWITGPILFASDKGPHPVAGLIFFFAWFLGFVGGACAITGLYRDESKWTSILGLVIFPFSIIVLV